ncbi:MAG: hydrolase [Actinomycetia bacterium]|nr:hydrolase [Actinomycetes bacterium]
MRIQLNWFDEKLAHRIVAIEADEMVPADARNAATVMVVRNSPASAGVEVLMLKRPGSMQFAAGAYVFPGGSVDPADDQAPIAWHGPDAAEFGRRLGAAPELARALVCAAVRETFEEAGVLLAGTPDGEIVVPDGPSWEADRVALTDGSVTFAELLASHGLVLRADLLTPWARWITPVAEPRRFDARFFAAALPAGQQVRGHAAEADKIAWLRPGDALDAARKGSMRLLPPTATTLGEFVAATGVADIVGCERTVAPIQPVLINEDGQAWLEVPDNVGYPL